jgi:MFS family permease
MRSSRERVFQALNLYHFVNDAIVFLLPTMMATFYDLFDLSYTQTSLILASNFGMVVLFQILNGYLADKGREKWLYSIGISLLVLSTFLLMLSHDFSSLWFFATLNGIGLGFVHAIVYVLGARLYPVDREIKLSRQGFFGDFGKVCAIFSSAIILYLDRTAWKTPLILWGVIALVIGVAGTVVMFSFPFSELNGAKKVDLTQKLPLDQEKPADFISSKGEPINKRRTIVLLFTLFIIYTGSQEISIKFFVLYLHTRRLGLSNTYAEVAFGVLMGVGMLGTYLSGTLKRKFGFRNFMVLLYCLNIATLISFLLIDLDSLVADIIFAGLLGYSILSVYITVQSELSFYVSFKRLGLGYGLLLGIGWFGGFMSTLTVGPLADIYGGQTIYIMALILSLLAFVLVFTIPQRRKN